MAYVITGRCQYKLLLANILQLFSASSVQESKAATRLGENVRLLTYVSIFYLPLSFCSVRSLAICISRVFILTHNSLYGALPIPSAFPLLPTAWLRSQALPIF